MSKILNGMCESKRKQHSQHNIQCVVCRMFVPNKSTAQERERTRKREKVELSGSALKEEKARRKVSLNVVKLQISALAR